MEINWEEIYKYYNFIKWQNSELISKFMFDNINNSSGWFLNRLGGSDFDALFKYVKMDKDINNYDIIHWMNHTKELNGYFDKSTNEETQKQNFIKYLEKIHNCLINSDAYTNPCGLIQNNFNIKDKNDFNKSL